MMCSSKKKAPITTIAASFSPSRFSLKLWTARLFRYPGNYHRRAADLHMPNSNGPFRFLEPQTASSYRANLSDLKGSGSQTKILKGAKSSHNSIIFQLDLGLDQARPKAPQILMGWAIEPDDRPYAPYPYRIHNLEYKYRLAPPFSEDEARRAIEILGAAADRGDPIAANNAIESAWAAIVGVA
jgi:hypothetical protein